MEESIRMTENRDKWKKYVRGVVNPRIEDGERTEQVWIWISIWDGPDIDSNPFSDTDPNSDPMHGVYNWHWLLLLLLFNALFSRTTWVCWYQKGKTSLDKNEVRDDGVLEWQWHQLDHMQTICTSLQTDNHTNTLPLRFLQTGCSSWRPTNRVKALWNNNKILQIEYNDQTSAKYKKTQLTGRVCLRVDLSKLRQH